MANYRNDIVDIQLKSGSVHRSFLCHSLGEADENANRFGVRLFRGNEPVNINGSSCIGYFIRHAKGDTVVIDGGTFSGNEAYVTLPKACYAYDGSFSLAIKLVGGGVTGTMRIVDGSISNTTTGSPIDPGSVVPSLESLMAVIERAEDAAETIAGLSIATELVSGENYNLVISHS